MKAEDIIDKQLHGILSGLKVYSKEAVLAVAKEIAELSFDAGANYAEYLQCKFRIQ